MENVKAVSPPAKTPGKRSGPFMRFVRRYLKHYLAAVPFFALFIAFIFWPMIYGLLMSFTDWTTKANSVPQFVGLTNLKQVLDASDAIGRRYITGLTNLFWFVVITMPVGIFTATLVSLVINQFEGRAYRFVRGSFFLPYVIPAFLASGIWLWLMAPDAGFLSITFAKMGLGVGVSWRSTPGYFTALLIFVDLWRAVGFNMVVLTAGMKGIPGELYEAATVDGANTFQQWIRITLPMLEPILFFVIVNGFIGAIQVFDIPWILTSSSSFQTIGGPNQFGTYPVMEIVGRVYSNKPSSLGQACSEGLILMAIIFVITLVQLLYRNHQNRD